jgi:hypothetical protein
MAVLGNLLASSQVEQVRPWFRPLEEPLKGRCVHGSEVSGVHTLIVESNSVRLW